MKLSEKTLGKILTLGGGIAGGVCIGSLGAMYELIDWEVEKGANSLSQNGILEEYIQFSDPLRDNMLESAIYGFGTGFSVIGGAINILEKKTRT